MPPRLAASLLDAHGLGPVPLGRDSERALRPDQALLGAAEAPIAVGALEAAGVPATRIDPALADAGRTAPADPGDWRAGALALGLRLPRPGSGELVALHRERLAAPGRVVACAGPLAAGGAFGMLALAVDPLTLAAAMAGAPLVLEPPRGLALELTGVLPPGAEGADLALALLARVAGEDRPPLLELSGPGAEGLSMADRQAVAWSLAQAGVAALFASDDATRAELAALGRDEDWRRLAAGGEPDALLDLASVAPAAAPIEDPARARPLAELAGEPIERVWIGPGATFADLERLARRLARGRHERVEVVVAPGTRSLADRIAAEGLAARLAAAGVRIEGDPAALMAPAGGAGLCFGVGIAALAGGRARWLAAGIGACAAAALRGAVAAPEETAIEDGPEARPTRPGRPADPWIAPEPAPAREFEPPRPRRPRSRFRGEALAVLGDDVDAATLLPAGPRLERHRGRPRALAGHLLAGRDPAFAERARLLGGGVLVAGERFGRGGDLDFAALCLAEAGIWAVLARSYAPGGRAALTRAGVLPLSLAAGRAPAAGAEIELPGMPEALVAGGSLVARDLTRGAQLFVAHERSAREIAIVRAGGLLPFALAAGA